MLSVSSFLKSMFGGQQQMMALANMIQAALILKYNKHKVGWLRYSRPCSSLDPERTTPVVSAPSVGGSRASRMDTMYNPHLVNMKFIPGAQLLRGVEGVCGHVRNTALE